MTDDKKNDSTSAPTRIREVRPAARTMVSQEQRGAQPAATQPATTRAFSGTPSPTAIRGVTGQSASHATASAFDPVVGWLVIVEGPGRGQPVNIYSGMNSLGRAAGQRIRIDFGDASISGEGAAFITFEPKRRTFHINHGGKSNIVYLNDEPVLAPVPMPDRSSITIGETKFRFVQLCGADFGWDDQAADHKK